VYKIPRHLYELVDLLGKHIDWQFYGYELSAVLVPKKRAYTILKILRKSVLNGSVEYFVRWAGYFPDFDSRFPAKGVKNMTTCDYNYFYVTLLSNALQKLYSSNTLSSFTVHLAQPLDLGSTDRW
jgi:hypothetical protein